MGRARVQRFRPGEMPLMILSLLEERPSNGHELMGALRRNLPAYSPSAGTVYPALTALRVEGLIEEDDGLRRGGYRPTAAGLELLAAKRDLLAEIQGRVRAAGEDVRLGQAIERFNERVRAGGDGADLARVEAILDRAAAAIERLDR